MRKICLLLTTLTLPISALAGEPGGSAKPVETLPRTAKWNMHYDDDSCSIWGQFGAGKNEVLVRMSRYQPGSVTELVLYGQRFAKQSVYSKVLTDFNSDGTNTVAWAMNGKSDKLPLVMLGNRDLAERTLDKPAAMLPDLSAEQQDAVENVTLRIGREKPFLLPISPAAGVWGALRTCTTNLVKLWGFDPDQQAHLQRTAMPITSPANWVVSNDYPDKALYSGISGVVHFRLDVGSEGQVEACHIQMASKGPEFAQVTCAAIQKRAKFTPALDQAGKPVRSYFVAQVRWLNSPP